MKDLVITERQKLVAVADAIRSKSGINDGMSIDEMPNRISEISGGGNITVADDGNGNVIMYNVAITETDGNIRIGG